jgi:non-ribosomal peptide synthetase component E (peptide arylation enzyme)
MDLATDFPAGYAARMRKAGHWRGRLALDDFNAALHQWPDHSAVVDFNSTTGRRSALTYRELNDCVDCIASGLLRLGVGAAMWFLCKCRTGGRFQRYIWHACVSVR